MEKQRNISAIMIVINPKKLELIKILKLTSSIAHFKTGNRS